MLGTLAKQPNLLERIREEIKQGHTPKKPKLSELMAISANLPLDGEPLLGVSVDECNTAIDKLLRYGVALTDLSREAFEVSRELRGEHQVERMACQLNLFMWTTGNRRDLDTALWVYDGAAIWNGNLRAYKGPHDFRGLCDDLRLLLQSDAQEKSKRWGKESGKERRPTEETVAQWWKAGVKQDPSNAGPDFSKHGHMIGRNKKAALRWLLKNWRPFAELMGIGTDPPHIKTLYRYVKGLTPHGGEK